MEEPDPWNYKPAQRVFERWLQDTVAQLGHPDPAPSTSITTTNRSHSRLKTHELIKLTRIVATHAPPVSVPSRILRTLEYVIHRRHAAHLSCSGRPGLAGSNASHARFTIALRDIHTLLRPLEITKPVQQHIAAKGEVSDEIRLLNAPVNVFEQLYLEESEDYSDVHDRDFLPTNDTENSHPLQLTSGGDKQNTRKRKCLPTRSSAKQSRSYPPKTSPTAPQPHQAFSAENENNMKRERKRKDSSRANLMHMRKPAYATIIKAAIYVRRIGIAFISTAMLLAVCVIVDQSLSQHEDAPPEQPTIHTPAAPLKTPILTHTLVEPIDILHTNDPLYAKIMNFSSPPARNITSATEPSPSAPISPEMGITLLLLAIIAGLSLLYLFIRLRRKDSYGEQQGRLPPYFVMSRVQAQQLQRSPLLAELWHTFSAHECMALQRMMRGELISTDPKSCFYVRDLQKWQDILAVCDWESKYRLELELELEIC